MKILIDNGHGINTPGKCSPDGDHREYKWTREIARRIVQALKEKSYDAILLTPENGDISLGQRCMRAQSWVDNLGKDRVILISIHNNAAGNGQWLNARGWSAYTTKGHTKADDLATELYHAASKHLKEYAATFSADDIKNKQKPIRTDYSDNDPDLEEDYYILRHTACPAVLTENLFQDNRKDVALLQDERCKAAIVALHVEGIINYIKAQGK